MKKFLINLTVLSIFVTALSSCSNDDTIVESEVSFTDNETPDYVKKLLTYDSVDIYGDTKSTLFSATGLANKEFASKMGPYQVSTNAVLDDCNKLVGVAIPILQSIGLLDNTIRCNSSFPYGFSSPVSTSVYYPTNIRNMDKLPVVSFVGGILSNQGNYHEMMKLWASNGFVVVISSNFINSFPTMHILGTSYLSDLNRDSNSPLYGKLDLSRTILTGHSAGGASTLQTASISASTMKLIDPELKVIGNMPIEPGPIGLGSTLKSPSLVLSGSLDIICPAWAWPNLWQGNLINDVPGWSATATTATHFSPVLATSRNEFSGITVAFLKYLAYNDSAAKAYFVGSKYKLKSDTQFVQSIFSITRVDRNSKADALK